jgi:hypothetical protein
MRNIDISPLNCQMKNRFGSTSHPQQMGCTTAIFLLFILPCDVCPPALPFSGFQGSGVRKDMFEAYGFPEA